MFTVPIPRMVGLFNVRFGQRAPRFLNARFADPFAYLILAMTPGDFAGSVMKILDADLPNGLIKISGPSRHNSQDLIKARKSLLGMSRATAVASIMCDQTGQLPGGQINKT